MTNEEKFIEFYKPALKKMYMLWGNNFQWGDPVREIFVDHFDKKGFRGFTLHRKIQEKFQIPYTIVIWDVLSEFGYWDMSTKKFTDNGIEWLAAE